MLVLFLIVIFSEVVTIRGDCDYKPYFDGPVTVLHPIHNDYVFSTNMEHGILSNNQRITLFCESSFQLLEYYSNRRLPLVQMITLDCEEDDLYYSTDVFIKEQMSRSPQFKCPQSFASFYATKLEHCDYEGLLYGIRAEHTPIVFAEFCYNYNNSEVVFVHYVAAKRNALLSEQSEYNPSPVNTSALDSELKVSSISQLSTPLILGSKFTPFTPVSKHLLDNADYFLSELVSISTYLGHFKSYHESAELVNTFPSWTNLKNGNWKVFQNILDKVSSKRSLEIYAGHSHTAKYPPGFTCNSEDEITFEWKGEDRSVPLYIWNYIIPRDHDDSDDEVKEFILIGINSPFVEVSGHNSLVICEDICEQIDWLHPLEATRKIPAFGYIFCCKPEDVQGVLKGLPRRNFV